MQTFSPSKFGRHIDNSLCPSALPQLILRTAVAALLTTLISLPAWAVPYGFTDESWEGCSAFLQALREEIGRANVVETTELRWDELAPEDGLIVIYPLRSLHAEELSAFLRSGGRVALLDDFGASDANLDRFQMKRIPAPKRPANMLRNNPALAIAEPVSETENDRTVGVHPAVSSANFIVTNHPAALTHPNLTPVLRIPAVGEPDGIVAVAGQVGKGRLFVISDGSVIINQMLRYPGNRALVQGLGRYLTADDTVNDARVKRGGKVYVVARSFEETGAFGNQSSVAKSLSAMLRDQRRWLADLRSEGLPAAVSIVLGVLSSLLGAVLVGTAVARIYHRRPPRYANAMPLVAQGGIAGRAAVLAAPTTHKALVLLEIKSALEESVATKFHLQLPLSIPDLLDTIAEHDVLSEADFRRLKQLTNRMSSVETSIAAGHPLRVREREVLLAAKQVDHVLARIEQKGRSR